MSNLPTMDQAPEAADLLALLRAHLGGDDVALQALLVETRIDTFAMVAMLAGHAVYLGTQVFGSAEGYDQWLAQEQQAQGRG